MLRGDRYVCYATMILFVTIMLFDLILRPRCVEPRDCVRVVWVETALFAVVQMPMVVWFGYTWYTFIPVKRRRRVGNTRT